MTVTACRRRMWRSASDGKLQHGFHQKYYYKLVEMVVMFATILFVLFGEMCPLY